MKSTLTCFKVELTFLSYRRYCYFSVILKMYLPLVHNISYNIVFAAGDPKTLRNQVFCVPGLW